MTTLCTLSLGVPFASSSSSGHPGRQSAALRRRVTLAPYPPPYRVAFASSCVPYRLALSLACARATLGTYALHRPRERGRLTTFREFSQQVGLGCLCAPGGSTGASVRRENSLTCPPCPFGAGAAWWLSPRPRHDASPRGFRCLLRTDSCPTVTPCATHRVALSRVLATPPLPATPPRCGNRWHHTRLDHRFFFCLSQ